MDHEETRLEVDWEQRRAAVREALMRWLTGPDHEPLPRVEILPRETEDGRRDSEHRR